MTTQILEPPGATRPRLRVAESAAYVLTGFPIAVAGFVVLVAGVSVGLGTLPIVVGVGVLALTLGVAHGFAGLERVRLDWLVGRRLPRPAYKPARGGTVGRAVSAGSDPRRWLDLAHGLVAFPVAVTAFSVMVGWFAAAAGGLGYVLWEWSLPHNDPDNTTLAELIGLGDSRTADILLTTGLGVVFAVTLPFVVRGCAAVQAGVAWSLLFGYPDAPAHHAAGQPTGQPTADRPTGHAASPPTGQPTADPPTGHAASPPAGQSTADRPTSHAASPPAGQPAADPPTGHAGGPPTGYAGD